MTRSTDSRRARNSASLTIGARRRPASRPSRRRCFLASRRVDPPMLVISSSGLRGLRTRVTVLSGSSEEPPESSPERRRRRRRREPPVPSPPSWTIGVGVRESSDSSSESLVGGVLVAAVGRPATAAPATAAATPAGTALAVTGVLRRSRPARRPGRRPRGLLGLGRVRRSSWRPSRRPSSCRRPCPCSRRTLGGLPGAWSSPCSPASSLASSLGLVGGRGLLGGCSLAWRRGLLLGRLEQHHRRGGRVAVGRVVRPGPIRAGSGAAAAFLRRGGLLLRLLGRRVAVGLRGDLGGLGGREARLPWWPSSPWSSSRRPSWPGLRRPSWRPPSSPADRRRGSGVSGAWRPRQERRAVRCRWVRRRWCRWCRRCRALVSSSARLTAVTRATVLVAAYGARDEPGRRTTKAFGRRRHPPRHRVTV